MNYGLALPLHDRRAKRRLGENLIVPAQRHQTEWPLTPQQERHLRHGLLAGSLDGRALKHHYVLSVRRWSGRELILVTRSWERYCEAVQLGLRMRESMR